MADEQCMQCLTYCRHDLGVAAVKIYWKQPVAEYQNELHHLKLGQIPGRYSVSNLSFDCIIFLPLPPEIFLDLRTAGRQEVIQIHHRVDTSIEKCEKTAVTTSDKSRKLIREHSLPVITV